MTILKQTQKELQMILTDPFVRVTYRSSPPCSTNTTIASADRNVVASRHPVTATSIAAVAAIAASVAAETASRGSGVRVALQLCGTSWCASRSTLISSYASRHPLSPTRVTLAEVSVKKLTAVPSE